MTRKNTYDHLYPQVYEIDNLYLAWRRARRDKRGHEPAASFEFDVEANLLQLQAEPKVNGEITEKCDLFHSENARSVI